MVKLYYTATSCGAASFMAAHIGKWRLALFALTPSEFG